MPSPDNLIASIQAVLANSRNDPVMLRRLSAEYGHTCHEVNGRLAQCALLLRQGKRAEALALAHREPNLLTFVAALDFPGRLRWQQLLQQHQIPLPPPLRVDLLSVLRAGGIAEVVASPPVPPPLNGEAVPVIAPRRDIAAPFSELKLPAATAVGVALACGVVLLLMIFLVMPPPAPTTATTSETASRPKTSTAKATTDPLEKLESLPAAEEALPAEPSDDLADDLPTEPLVPPTEAEPDASEEATLTAKSYRAPLATWVRPTHFDNYPEPVEEVPERQETSALAFDTSVADWTRPVTLWRSQTLPTPDAVRLIGDGGAFSVKAEPGSAARWNIAYALTPEVPLARLVLEQTSDSSILQFQWLPESAQNAAKLEELRRCALEMTWDDTELYFLLTKLERAPELELSATFERIENIQSSENLAVHVVGASRFPVRHVRNTSDLHAILLDNEPRIGIKVELMAGRSENKTIQRLACRLGFFSRSEYFTGDFRTIFGNKEQVSTLMPVLELQQKTLAELTYAMEALKEELEIPRSSEKVSDLKRRLNQLAKIKVAVQEERQTLLGKMGESFSDDELRYAIQKWVMKWADSGMPEVQATVYRRVHDAAKSRWLGIPIRVYGDHLATVEVLSL